MVLQSMNSLRFESRVQSRYYKKSNQPLSMRKLLIPILLILLFSPVAQAETYCITGRQPLPITHPLRSIMSTFSAFQYFACYQYRGAQSITDAYGYHSILIDVTDEEDELDLLLNLRGENFTHTIDILHTVTRPTAKWLDINRTESTTIRRIPRFWLLHRLVHTRVCFRLDANRSSSFNQTRSHGVHGYETSNA